MSDSQLEEIEITITEATKQVDRMDALLRLSNNSDFKSIIEDGYFKDEASNLVLLKAAPAFAKESDQKRIDNNIIGIGCLRQHLSGIIQIGTQAKKSIADHEQMRTEVLAEGD